MAQGLCDMHYKRLRRSGALGLKAPVPLLDLLLAHVDPGLSDCWFWTGNLTDDGYGRYNLQRAHRALYRELVGPIRPGLHLDHLCRNKPCVNPDHLEPVTPATNALRGIGPCVTALRDGRCIRGHAFNAENTVVRGDGSRACRPCLRLRDAAYRDRRRAAA
jgi:hypothetical protein